MVLGDLNHRVGDEMIEGIVGKYGVRGRNKVVNDYSRCVKGVSRWLERITSRNTHW